LPAGDAGNDVAELFGAGTHACFKPLFGIHSFLIWVQKMLPGGTSAMLFDIAAQPNYNVDNVDV
jgi:hypothetical protein